MLVKGGSVGEIEEPVGRLLAGRAHGAEGLERLSADDS